MMISDPRFQLFGFIPVGCPDCHQISIGWVVILFLKVNGFEGMTMGVVWKHA